MNTISEIFTQLDENGQSSVLQYAQKLLTEQKQLLSEQNQEARLNTFLALQGIQGFGAKSLSLFHQFTKRVDVDWCNVEEVHLSLQNALSTNKRLKVPELTTLQESLTQVSYIKEQYQKHQINIVPIWSDEYPKRMTSLEDAPIFLYCKGNVSALNAGKSVAVIGTRQPTHSGFQAGIRYGKIFAQKGFVVVSGLAIGCDTAGHQGCLEASGITVAVLAHSLDVPIYPKENTDLAKQILMNNGLLISEYPLNTKSNRASFVQRDKWQAALSDGVIVVETDVKGGTMHTVDYTKGFGKKIGCLYLERDDWKTANQAQGNLKLLGEGAIRLSSPNEIVAFAQDIVKSEEI